MREVTSMPLYTWIWVEYGATGNIFCKCKQVSTSNEEGQIAHTPKNKNIYVHDNRIMCLLVSCEERDRGVRQQNTLVEHRSTTRKALLAPQTNQQR